MKGRAQRALLAHTRPWHQHLEATVDIPRRLRDLATYRELLSRLWQVHVGIEAWLAANDWPRRRPSWELGRRRKAPLLASDLRACGGGAAPADRLQPLAPPPSWQTEADVVGCLYVVEGATLGGQVLSRLAAARLGVGPASGGTFLAGYGRATRAMWQGWLAVVERELQGDERLARGCRVATEAFALFHRGLVEPQGRPEPPTTAPAPPSEEDAPC